MVTTQTVFAPNQIADLMAASAAAPYEIDPDAPPAEKKYEGWTRLEVMLDKQTQNAAATGDRDAIEKVMDRLVGKPKTIAEVRRMDYESWLKREAEREAAERGAIPAEVVDDVDKELEGL